MGDAPPGQILPHFVIANSRATLETVQLKGKPRATVIGSGVDLSKFSPSRVSGDESGRAE